MDWVGAKLHLYNRRSPFHSCPCSCRKQWRIQDFPQGGAPTPKSAIIFQFFAENCMKMKEFGPPGGGARPWRPPLDLPMGSMASFADASVQSTRRHITISHFNAALNLLFYFRWTVMEEILPLVQGPFYQTIIAIIEVVTNSAHTFKARKEILSRIAISDKFLIQTPFPWQNMWDHSGTFFSKFVSIVINTVKLNISLSESLFE